MKTKKEYNAAYYAAHREQILAQKKVYHKANKAKIRARKLAYYRENAAYICARSKAYSTEHKIRQSAKDAVKYAVQTGRLVRPPVGWCCGGAPVDAHHPDYSHPLDVVWLCRGCHQKLHKEHDRVNS